MTSPHKTTCLLVAILASAFAAFSTRAADSVVVFNEINYNPKEGQPEFIELRNLHGVDVNIAGWTITGGIDFTLPAGTVIPGHGYMVLGAVPGAEGAFTGALDNAGDTLRLRNLMGRIMDEVSYDDEGDWPIGADGSGATLARREASADSGPTAWTASTQLGGTPGAQNFPLFVPIDRSLIVNRASWKYRDDAAAPPADWLSLTFDDAAWTQGNAPLGTPASGVPTLTVTTDLVERFRASAITGVADGAVVTSWLDDATGDGVSQNADRGGEEGMRDVPPKSEFPRVPRADINLGVVKSPQEAAAAEEAGVDLMSRSFDTPEAQSHLPHLLAAAPQTSSPRRRRTTVLRSNQLRHPAG